VREKDKRAEVRSRMERKWEGKRETGFGELLRCE